MIHHMGVFASDFEASRTFYTAALEPLGLAPQYESERVSEFWRKGEGVPSLSLERGEGEVTRGLHLAFVASDRAEVDAFHAAALAGGGTERHPPRRWPEYRAYCAFVSDPDGNNIEAVCKEP